MGRLSSGLGVVGVSAGVEGVVSVGVLGVLGVVSAGVLVDGVEVEGVEAGVSVEEEAGRLEVETALVPRRTTLFRTL